MKTRTFRILFIGAVAVAAAFPVLTVTAEDADEGPKFDYTVENGRVDESTMMGYQIYTGTCMPCHGPDGLGSSFAPSLIRAAERRTFSDFARTVAEGRDVLPGQVMPSFADDERVMSHLTDIWNYLGARAEGGLERGRPQLLDEGRADEEQGGEEPSGEKPDGAE